MGQEEDPLAAGAGSGQGREAEPLGPTTDSAEFAAPSVAGRSGSTSNSGGHDITTRMGAPGAAGGGILPAAAPEATQAGRIDDLAATPADLRPTCSPAPAPSPTAAVAAAPAPAAAPPAAAAADEVCCLVCQDGPRQHGFLHGGSMHGGVCGECAELVRARPGVLCPIWEPVEPIVAIATT